MESTAVPYAVQRVLFHSWTSFNEADLWSVRIDGTGLTRLTSEPSVDVAPSLSPNLRSIAFASARTGESSVFVADSDGSNRTMGHRSRWMGGMVPRWLDACGRERW
jgi:Tol biopolymer transport system component